MDLIIFSKSHKLDRGSISCKILFRNIFMADKKKQLQILFFRWGKEEFGIEIGDIQEIIAFENERPVPLAPSFLNRVMNIRGKIIAVFYLNKLLKISGEAKGANPRVLVMRNKDIQAGIYVDSVSEIYFINASCLTPVSEPLSGKTEGRFLKGEIEMKTGEKKIPLFDSETIAKFLMKIEF